MAAFSQSGLIATLRAKGISASDISDVNLGLVITESLSDYNFYHPNKVMTAYEDCITTVAGQPSYDMPTGALWVVSVGWNPDYANSDIGDVWKEIMLNGLSDTDPSVMLMDYRKMSLLHKYFKGFWEMLDGKIFLKPCPDGVYSVSVVYATARSLGELDDVKDNRFKDLCYYNAMLAVGTTKLTGGGWSGGQFKVSESVGKETMKVAEKGLEKTKLLLANAWTARRS